MIEPNVGIICACLPMCRLPLTIFFPSIFPPKTANSTSYATGPRSNNGTYGHAGTGKNEWVPSRGGGNDERSINLITVSRGMSDDTSEEFIMHKEAGRAPEDAKKIHRVTNYAVTYEDDDEIPLGGRDSSRKN